VTRIVQLTDTHIVAPGAKAYGVVDTATALRQAVAHIKTLHRLSSGIDAVILTGDLTDHGTPEEYAHLAAILSELDLPLHAIPGNHDQREPMRDAFKAEPLFSNARRTPMPQSGPVNWCLTLSDFDVIGLDTLVEGEPHGELSQETLDWLDSTLVARAGRPVLVALHHPPFDTGVGHMDENRLRDAEALIGIASGHNGPLQIICGHVHRYITTQIEGVPMMIAPAPAHAVTFDLTPQGPSTLSMEPGGVLIHEWRMQAGKPGFMNHLSMIGPFSGPYPFQDPDGF
jgi:Icc protein